MNSITISGILESLEFSHTIYDRPRYAGFLAVPRPSGVYDRIPIQMWGSDLTVGEAYTVTGEIRTNRYRGEDPQHPNKITYVMVLSVSPCDRDLCGTNTVAISGEVIYKSQIRFTPVTDKKIQTFQIFVPRRHHRSYPNIIAWESLADVLADMAVGYNVTVTGRLQSREYVKNGSVYRIHEICATGVIWLGKDSESNS